MNRTISSSATRPIRPPSLERDTVVTLSIMNRDASRSLFCASGTQRRLSFVRRRRHQRDRRRPGKRTGLQNHRRARLARVHPAGNAHTNLEGRRGSRVARPLTRKDENDGNAPSSD
jgi:hypothetical protein